MTDHQQQQQQTVDPALSEPGAWVCTSCGNHNFASRNRCNSRTCDSPRPFPPPPRSRPPQQQRRPRHDPKTSKQLVWAEQADQATLEHNQALRKRYLEDPDEMEPEERERAKVLIERDERKKRKKKQRKEKVGMRHDLAASSPPQYERKEKASSSPAVVKTQESKPKRRKPRNDASISEKPIVNRKMQREVKRRNKELRIQFQNGEKGMNPDDIERAKALIARDERKRAKKQRRSDK